MLYGKWFYPPRLVGSASFSFSKMGRILHCMFIVCSIRKVAEVLVEKDEILSTDLFIRYFIKRVHTVRIISSPSTQYINDKYSSTVDRYMYLQLTCKTRLKDWLRFYFKKAATVQILTVGS